MELQLDVDGEKFTVSVGEGLADFVWLAVYGAKLYGNAKYPKGNYIPTLLRIQSPGYTDAMIPHPRLKIKSYLASQQIEPQRCKVQVSLRKVNHHFIELERIWQRQAFGKQRDLMTLKFRYFADKLNRKKEFYFSVEVNYKMYEDVKHIYKESDYPRIQEVRLQEQIVNSAQSQFVTELKLPLGQATYCLYYYSKEDKNDEFKALKMDENSLKQNPKNTFNVEIIPQIIPKATVLQQVRQHMKIQEGISKSLEQKQQQTKKKSNNTALCCFTFQQLWAAIQQHDKKIQLSKFEQSTTNKIKFILEQHMAKLYQVFSYYFIVSNQQKDKKEDLTITFQDVMHCIKFYDILQDSQTVANFFDYYNMDGRIKSVADTLNLNKGIKFPEFVSILLKVTQFIQTVSLMKESQTFDKSVESVIGSIVAKEADESNKEKFTPFHRNLRQQIKLIGFFREHSSEFASVFIHQIEDSIQATQDTYFMMKQQVKVLLKLAGVDGDYDQIVKQCFGEVFPDRQRQQRFQQGLYFYQLLQVVQWLAMILIESNQDSEEEKDEQEQMTSLMDRIKFLLQKFSKYK